MSSNTNNTDSNANYQSDLVALSVTELRNRLRLSELERVRIRGRLTICKERISGNDVQSLTIYRHHYHHHHYYHHHYYHHYYYHHHHHYHHYYYYDLELESDIKLKTEEIDRLNRIHDRGDQLRDQLTRKDNILKSLKVSYDKIRQEYDDYKNDINKKLGDNDKKQKTLQRHIENNDRQKNELEKENQLMR